MANWRCLPTARGREFAAVVPLLHGVDARIAAAEIAYLYQASPPTGAPSDVAATIAAAEQMRSYGAVRPALWAKIFDAVRRVELTQHGRSHQFRAMVLLAAVNPRAGSRAVRRLFAESVRVRDSTARTFSLLLMAAIESRPGGSADAKWLVAEAARSAGGRDAARGLVRAIGQLADLDTRIGVEALLPCKDVPAILTRSRAECESRAVAAQWRDGKVGEALAGARRLASSVVSGDPASAVELSDRIVPILAAAGAWAHFDRLIERAVSGARRLKDDEALARSLVLFSIGARARGHHATTSSALEEASQLETTDSTRLRVEAALARAAVHRGDSTRALSRIERLVFENRPATLPQDVRLLARSLGATTAVHREQTAADGTEVLGSVYLSELEAAERVDGWTARNTTSERPPTGVEISYSALAEWNAERGRPDDALLALEKGRGGASSIGEIASIQAGLPEDVGVLVFGDFGAELRWWYRSSLASVEGVSAMSSSEARALLLRYSSLVATRGSAAQIARASGHLFREVLGAELFRGSVSVPVRLIVVPNSVMVAVPFEAVFEDHVDGLIVARALSLGHARAANYPSRTGSRVAFIPRAGRDARAEAAAMGPTARILGPKATVAAFREMAPSASVLHFGGHTWRGTVAGTAGLTFARGVLLDSDYLGGLDLPGTVVVLLGCHTGRPAETGGATPQLGRSIADAFLSAGGRAVAGTLWAIDDQTAAEVAELMYSSNETIPSSTTWASMRAELRNRYPGAYHRWAGLVWYGSAGS
ncbi:MAG: CHAT domain-containing protein [Acidobacteria bacterium]|nr:CHAT domain-containing protein [Acidobacteriota bacterium]